MLLAFGRRATVLCLFVVVGSCSPRSEIAPRFAETHELVLRPQSDPLIHSDALSGTVVRVQEGAGGLLAIAFTRTGLTALAIATRSNGGETLSEVERGSGPSQVASPGAMRTSATSVLVHDAGTGRILRLSRGGAVEREEFTRIQAPHTAQFSYGQDALAWASNDGRGVVLHLVDLKGERLRYQSNIRWVGRGPISGFTMLEDGSSLLFNSNDGCFWRVEVRARIAESKACLSSRLLEAMSVASNDVRLTPQGQSLQEGLPMATLVAFASDSALVLLQVARPTGLVGVLVRFAALTASPVFTWADGIGEPYHPFSASLGSEGVILTDGSSVYRATLSSQRVERP